MSTPEITTLQHLQFHQRSFNDVKEAYKNQSTSVASAFYVDWSRAFKRFLEAEYPSEVQRIELLDHMRGVYLVITYDDFIEKIGNSVELLLNELIEDASKKSTKTNS